MVELTREDIEFFRDEGYLVKRERPEPGIDGTGTDKTLGRCARRTQTRGP